MEINMANPDRAELNSKLTEKHGIKEPCEVFGRGYDAEIDDCKACKTDCKEYATTCSNLTKGIIPSAKKGGSEDEGSKEDLVLESNSDKNDSKTLITKGSKKMKTATKKKVTTKKKAIVKKISPSTSKKEEKFGGWREGSSADIIHQAVLNSGKKGIDSNGLCKKLKGKFETSNLMERIKTVLTAAVKLDLLKRSEDGIYSKK
jgi:hypothetical protein